MRRAVLVLGFLLLSIPTVQARRARVHEKPKPVLPTTFTIGGLLFAIPPTWKQVPAESRARAGQWQIDPPAGSSMDGILVVAFYFGPGLGGTAQENINAWSTLVTMPDGHPAAGSPQTHDVTGRKVTQVLLSGTYSQVSSQPGLPPFSKPNYSLLGTIVENPTGNTYWRVTGPAAEVSALAPEVNRVIDGLTPQASP